MALKLTAIGKTSSGAEDQGTATLTIGRGDDTWRLSPESQIAVLESLCSSLLGVEVRSPQGDRLSITRCVLEQTSSTVLYDTDTVIEQ